MLNTSENIDMSIRRTIVDDFAQKLINSGYSIPSSRKIVIAGLKGYEKKVYNSKKEGGRKLRRTAKESNVTRQQKKMTAKTEWFRERKRCRDLLDESLEEDEIARGWKRSKRSGWKDNISLPDGCKRKNERKEDEMIKIRSLLFVVGTKKGELAADLRKVVLRMKKIVKYNTKIVERGGSKLRHILSNSNPWKGKHCER